MGGLGVIYKVLGDDTGGALAVVEHPIEPGRLVRPHTHTNEDEISYVVEGEVGIRIGEEETIAKPGTWVFKPRGIPHTFWNPGPKTARIIEIITPGAFAHYFEELALLVSGGGPPDQEKLAELARKYGLTYHTELISALKARYNLKLTGE
jgi:quercetin dioxygenase-like cupin family protein